MADGKDNIYDLEKRLWSAADELRANSKLKSSEYSIPVLGLICLRYADHRFTVAQAEVEGKSTGRRKVGKTDYQARGVLYLPEQARFSNLHRKGAKDTISVYDVERVAETVRLCRMNLAVHGLAGDVKQGNSYYEDPFADVSPSTGSGRGGFDFVMANPPFNVDKIDKERIKDDKAHFPFGMPKTDNGNYLWIQLFYSDLNDKGRAGFVMANSASDARVSEL